MPESHSKGEHFVLPHVSKLTREDLIGFFTKLAGRPPTPEELEENKEGLDELFQKHGGLSRKEAADGHEPA